MSECDREASIMRRPWPATDRCTEKLVNFVTKVSIATAVRKYVIHFTQYLILHECISFEISAYSVTNRTHFLRIL